MQFINADIRIELVADTSYIWIRIVIGLDWGGMNYSVGDECDAEYGL